MLFHNRLRCRSRSENQNCSFSESKMIEFGSSSSFETSQRKVLNVPYTKYVSDATMLHSMKHGEPWSYEDG